MLRYLKLLIICAIVYEKHRKVILLVQRKIVESCLQKNIAVNLILINVADFLN